jgi:hypothetical protein
LSARTEHARRRDAFAEEAAKHESVAVRLSVLHLVLFATGVVLTGIGLSRGSYPYLAGGGAAFAVFAIAQVVHTLVGRKRDRAITRRDIHARNLARIEGKTAGFPNGAELLPGDHAYASDLDVVGAGSIYERIAVAHTRRGSETLARWLGAPASPEAVKARQEAVRELASDVELRQELEAAVLDTGDAALDARPFLELAQREPYVLARPALRIASIALPALSIVLALLSGGALPGGSWIPVIAVQGLVAWRTGSAVAERYALLSSRRRLVESFAALLRVIERAKWKAPALVALQERLRIDGKTPSEQLARLETWAGLFDLRTQGIAHVFVDLFLLWDLHCLAGVERWMKSTGSRCAEWFDVVGEVEALASLATLLHQDPGVVMPEIADLGAPLHLDGIAHPLIRPEARVRNDVEIPGPGQALVVTGSNMAGKSTLLRAIGASVALGLAGGPVCATRASIPPLRLRASMRIADSVQSGASYFQAELQRLRSVIAAADEPPPILFLLDELLRGTNARARHKGARAVVRHLLAKRAMGLVATHDVALSAMEEELPGKVGNVHFTDVLADGEMTFDYLLRPGVVRTSNALRLLKQAGIEVDADDALSDAPRAS